MLLASDARFHRAGIFALLGLAALLAPRLALAADYFVATNGDDEAPGTESRPFRTITRGMTAATLPGDTVWIRGGVYPADNWNNQLNFRFSGTEVAPITFRAYPGELPILDGTELRDVGASGVEIVDPATAPVSHIRIIGLVARNWGTSGFSNGWPENTPNLASSDIQFINCIADNNGVNGFSFAGASNLRMEGCISAHNGALLPSWSSGVSIFGGTGEIIIDGNVAFENIDISDNRTDGSGFILDEQTTHGYVVNNIAFRNGGSCLRVTLSSNITLMNNTCISNGQDQNVSFNNEIYLSEQQSGQSASIYNNVGIPGRGNPIEGLGYTQFFSGQEGDNLWLNNGASFVSATGLLDFHLAANANTLIDQGTAQYAPGTDIGFDPRCIRQETGLPYWWQYGIDYAYIESVGGVAGCFHRGVRPAGTAIDIGAYERNSTPAGCDLDTDCTDTDTCTRDLCAPGGQCVGVPIEGCCITDADCVDTDTCTIDTCDTTISLCSNAVNANCGQNASGTWSVNATTGYASVCNWGGFSWSAAGPAALGVNGTMSSIQSLGNLCYSGVVAAYEGYDGFAMLGININQANAANTVAENITLGGDGLNIAVDNVSHTPLRVVLQDVPNASGVSNQWCVELDQAGGFFPWTAFRTNCWAEDGVPYAGEPVNVIAVSVGGHNLDDRPFEFCLTGLTPSGDQCVGPPTGQPPGEGGGDDGGGSGGGGDDAAGSTDSDGQGSAGQQAGEVPATGGGCSVANGNPAFRGAAGWGFIGLLLGLGGARRRRSKSVASA